MMNVLGLAILMPVIVYAIGYGIIKLTKYITKYIISKS